MKSSRNFGEEAGSFPQTPFMLQLLPAPQGACAGARTPAFCLTGAQGSECLSVLTLVGDVSTLEDLVFTITEKTAPTSFLRF